jgi:hypothetical protein
VGLLAARARDGPVVFHRGRRYALDGARLHGLGPFRAVRDLAERLAGWLASPRSGDLVAFGAFAPAGNVAFDFELGSHGGIHPDELDSFLVHPRGAPVPDGGEVSAVDLYGFFRRRFGACAW